MQTLARLAALGVPAERITLICIGEHPGIAHFGGLGDLTADRLRVLPMTAACALLTPDALQLATRAWSALRQPTPHRLAQITPARPRPEPLLTVEPSDEPVGPHSWLRRTDMGTRVLAGQQDHLTRNGVDRWIGGVHLSGHHVPWRFDEGTETIRDVR